jgi:hypothetical protein
MVDFDDQLFKTKPDAGYSTFGGDHENSNTEPEELGIRSVMRTPHQQPQYY